ncbi:Fic family protein [Varibaculum cambriense]|uniref:Fic family protein n=1 Tax=Varibaculum cambriense TaxID=184870 RepID=UPI00292D5687|nr:Fic family protein [Varibaculum cambriense]
MGHYDKRHWAANLSAFSRDGRRSGDYRSYVPDLLAGNAVITEENSAAAALLERKILAFSPLISQLGMESLARLILRGEAIASSNIEGLQVAPRELARAELKEKSGTDPRSTAGDVIRNIQILEDATRKLASAETVSLADIVDLQQKLIPEETWQGIRSSQNWLGGSSYHPLAASYIPPSPEHLDGLLNDLVKYLNGAEHGALLQAALVHAQFESIHPFPDGNGRIGRALIHIVLTRRGLTQGATLPLSLALATRTDLYEDALSSYRHLAAPRSDQAISAVNQWIKVFLDACQIALTISESLKNQVEELQADWKARLDSCYRSEHHRALRIDAAANRLREQLPNLPMFTIASAAQVLKVSRPAIENAAKDLVAAGIVAPLNIGRGQRGWWQPDLFDLISGSERRLASTQWDTLASAPRRAVPNAQTARALTHTQRVIAGKDPEDGAVFEDANQATDFLDSLA